MRLFAELYGLPHPAGTFRHRHGRRMGRRRIAGDGSGTGALEGNPQRDFAKRLFDRVFAGGGCREVSLAGLGMATDVLDRRTTCPTSALYSDQSAGIGGLEAASR